jgi:hypothetical protein
MARKSVRFHLHDPPGEALERCQWAVLERGWDIVSLASGDLVARQKMSGRSWPVTISVEMSASDSETEVQVTGAVFGWGMSSLACTAAVEGLKETLLNED